MTPEETELSRKLLNAQAKIEAIEAEQKTMILVIGHLIERMYKCEVMLEAMTIVKDAGKKK